MNSSGEAGSWFTPQYTYDESPNPGSVSTISGAYASAPGFLAGFSDEVIQHLTEITNITALHKVDNDGFDGGSETTEDKVFLPSYTEMGFGYNNGIPEGMALAKFTSNTLRKKTNLQGLYWMRSPSEYQERVRCISDDGSDNYGMANDGTYGITPIIVIH